MPANDPYDPSDGEIDECNKTSVRIERQRNESDARFQKRIKKRGRKVALEGIWKDNPEGAEVWKATIAGIAKAYQDVTGSTGHALDIIAAASGLENHAAGKNGAVELDGRPYSPGDSGKTVRKFIKSAESSTNPKIQKAFADARAGKLLFEVPLDKNVDQDGSGGRLIGAPFSGTDKPVLAEALAQARCSKQEKDIKNACEKLERAAKAHAVGRYLFHAKRKRA